MSFGNNMSALKKTLAIIAAIVVTTAGLMIAGQLKAASTCTGPTFNAASKTLSLVCTESTDIHELSCADVTNPDILSLTVNGTTETVTCPPDVPPNTLPSVVISGPNSGDWGVSYTFAITGTDADVGDTLVYHVDWNNDGTPDYVSGSVPSGTNINVANSWSATGAQTFQARAVDSKGGLSPWVQHVITIGNPPAATVVLEASINGGGWSSSDQTVNPSDSVRLQWNSTYATSCSGSGSGFTASGANGLDDVNTPAANSSTNFQVTCTGPGGSGSDNLNITTRQLPNLTVTQNATPDYGTFSGGTYSSIRLYFRTNNIGGSDTTTQANYRLEFDINNDGDYLDAGETINRTDGIDNIVASSGENDNETITAPISIGAHAVRITVDTGSDISETDEGDNVYQGTITVPPQDPGLTINANPSRVQNGQSATVSWSISNPYSMSCSVFGPGMTTVNFDPTSTASGNRTVGPIVSKSEYTLSCNVGGTVFTDTVIIETQGVLEEI